MKTIFTLLFLLPTLLWAQTENRKPLTKAENTDRDTGLQRLRWGYQTSVEGWVIKNGDTLEMGKGTLPTKDFAFLYENPSAFLSSSTTDHRTNRNFLSSGFTGRKVILKELSINGSKKVGFGVYGIVGVGTLTRYYVQLDNAIDVGEILPPVQYRKSATSAQPVISVADELMKLKQLLDAGVLTQDEFNTQKKKLLNQ